MQGLSLEELAEPPADEPASTLTASGDEDVAAGAAAVGLAAVPIGGGHEDGVALQMHTQGGNGGPETAAASTCATYTQSRSLHCRHASNDQAQVPAKVARLKPVCGWLLICLLNHARASPRRINFNFNFKRRSLIQLRRQVLFAEQLSLLRCSVEAAIAADIAKVGTRLKALGISGFDAEAADAAAARGCTLSMLAQELLKKVPAKVLHPAKIA